MKNFGIFIVLVILALARLVSTLSCGGNCPTGDCKTCLCGSTPLYVSIDSFCKQSNKWEVNCCKCIISAASKGNAHFVAQSLTGIFAT
jgi:hypothetical protein